MSPTLDKFLCESFPKIFVERKLSARESCMGRGFECGDGWFPLIYLLCRNIQRHIDNRNESIKKYKHDLPPIDQFVALQVKEKFGALRIYHQGGDDYCTGLVNMAESASWFTCEVCGTGGPINVGHTKGWIQSVCAECAKDREWNKRVSFDTEIRPLMKKAVVARKRKYDRKRKQSTRR